MKNQMFDEKKSAEYVKKHIKLSNDNKILVIDELKRAQKFYSNSGFRSDLTSSRTPEEVPKQIYNSFEEYLDYAGFKVSTAYELMSRKNEKKGTYITDDEWRKLQKEQREKRRKAKLAAMPELKFKGGEPCTAAQDDKNEPPTIIGGKNSPAEPSAVVVDSTVVGKLQDDSPITANTRPGSHIANLENTFEVVDQKGALPPDCFAISESLMRKIIKYQFENDTILKILLLVMIESYGQKPHSKQTKPLTEEYIRKELKYPKNKNLQKEIKKIIKAKFIEVVSKNDDGVVYAIKKDADLWKDIFKFDEVASEEFKKVKDLYFEKAHAKNIDQPPFGGKEGMIIKRTISEYGLEKTMDMLTRYFDENHGNFAGYTLGGFRASINKIQMKEGYVGGKRISKITGQEFKDVGF